MNRRCWVNRFPGSWVEVADTVQWGLIQQLVSERRLKRAGLRVDFRKEGAFGCGAAITAKAGCLAMAGVWQWLLRGSS
ncbi:unnamed protein product [Lactuca virosa]|uniref:Uncharacterized protein n=1 Tax=Lactuca virosa TaxID=75947 RepID=A0AAU9PMM9_9ASTR|nr:unnamed protein product [Lactuca virosa]